MALYWMKKDYDEQLQMQTKINKTLMMKKTFQGYNDNQNLLSTSESDPWVVSSFNEDERYELLRNDTLQNDYIHTQMSYEPFFTVNARTQKDHYPWWYTHKSFKKAETFWNEWQTNWLKFSRLESQFPKFFNWTNY